MLTNWLMNEVQQAMALAAFPCGDTLLPTTLSGARGRGNDSQKALYPQLRSQNHPQNPRS